MGIIEQSESFEVPRNSGRWMSEAYLVQVTTDIHGNPIQISLGEPIAVEVLQYRMIQGEMSNE